MIESISAISVIPLSSYVNNVEWNYINIDRETQFITLSSEFGDIDWYAILNDLEDVYIDNYSINFLTKQISLSSVITFSDLFHVSYFANNVDDLKNKSVDITNKTVIENQFLITSPLSASTKINIIPLKNHTAVSDINIHGLNHRYYNKIYKKSEDIFLQFKSEKMPKYCESDETTTIHFPDKIESFELSSLSIIGNGAYIGDCPANSDNILLDRYGYSNITDSGYIGPFESAEPLCIWVSENGYFERWYDPLTVSQGDAYITPKATSILNSVIDIPTNPVIDERNKLQFLRLGEDRNNTFIQSLSSDLNTHFKTWNKRFQDETSNSSGFIVGDYDISNSDSLIMDGTIHGHVPPTSSLHDNVNMTVGLWVYSDDWTKGIDTQLWGNFSSEEGYGVFYNTGATNELVTIPSNNGNIYGFNFRGYKIFEKHIDSLSSSDFQLFTTDYFGNRWIWDKNSQQIVKLTSDDIVTHAIQLDDSVVLKTMKIDAQNLLFTLNSTTNTLSSFDTTGSLVSSQLIPEPSNNFDFNSENDLLFSYGDNMIVDSSDAIYTTIGRNIYKNSSIWYHIAGKIQTIKLDYDDNVYVFSGKKSLIKLNSNGDKLWDIEISTDKNILDRVEMSFMKENSNGIDFDVLWLVFNERQTLIKIDIDTGYIIRRIDLKNVINLQRCGEFILNVRGDFTGYEVKRKFERATSKNPAFSIKMNLRCGNTSRIVQSFVPAGNYKGWVHLALTHSIVNDKTFIVFYVNGKEAETIELNGVYQINHGTKITPFIIGGNSGKLGAKNVERSLNNSGYFIGRIADIRIYNRPLNKWSIVAISRYKFWNKWAPLTLPVPTLPRTYLEKIEQFHLNKYPVFKSNKFNIRIKGIPDDLSNESISTFIRGHIDNIKPAHTLLNDIIFE